MKKVNLPGNQEKIDVAPPKGKITAADFAALRKKKVSEGGDHEVAMAMSSLKEIVEAAQELMSKLGGQERNIPGWIQDHITNSENFIVQASQGFHEVHGDENPEDTSLMKMMQELETSTQTGIEDKQSTGVKGNINAKLFNDLEIPNFDPSKFGTTVSKIKRGATLTRDEEKMMSNTLIAMIKTKNDDLLNKILANLKTVEAG